MFMLMTCPFLMLLTANCETASTVQNREWFTVVKNQPLFLPPWFIADADEVNVFYPLSVGDDPNTLPDHSTG